MTRIIVHAGFHKTGTSTAQTFLQHNRRALSGHMRLLLRAEMEAVARSTRRVGRSPLRPWQRLRLRHDLRQLLRGLATDDPRPLVLSLEGFCGTLPGWGGVTDYRLAAPIAADLARALRNRFGPSADIRFLYTTREAEAWRRSAYAHLVKYQPLTLDYADFCTANPGAPGFEAALAEIRRRLSPIPVTATPLEALRDRPFSTAEMILDHLDLPDDLRASLTPQEAANVRESPETTEHYLHLNRTMADHAALRATKRPDLAEGRRR